MAEEYVISKHINGICLNPLEFLLDDDNFIMKFESIEKAKEFTKEVGIKNEDLGYSIFIGTMDNHDMMTGG
jgi:hypothetical protein